MQTRAPNLGRLLRQTAVSCGVWGPQDLEAMAESFGVKRKAGTVQAHGSGFGGSGFKFNAEEDERHNNERKVRLSFPSPLGTLGWQNIASVQAPSVPIHMYKSYSKSSCCSCGKN